MYLNLQAFTSLFSLVDTGKTNDVDIIHKINWLTQTTFIASNPSLQKAHSKPIFK